MRKFICLGFFSILFNPCFAQLPMLLDDQFNDNTNTWPIYETKEYDCLIKNGSYNIANRNSGMTFVCTPGAFNPALDFEIETKITFLSGSTYGFGICTNDLRFTKDNKSYYFTISKSGYYRLSSYSSGSETVYQEWEESSAIKKEANSTNTLKIKKTANKSTFFINDKLIHSLTDISFWGTEVGFIVYDTISIHADYLTIKQERGKINVLENKTVLKKENLGPNVNSDIQDLTPVISHDGQTLYFSVRTNTPDDKNNYNSEIFYSTLNKDGTWSKKKDIGYPLNNEESNFIISATPDNNSLLLSGRYNKDGTSYGDGLSISHREHNGWSVPEDVILDDFYNDNEFVSYSLAADRKTLILSVERKDSYGQADIYVSFQKNDNTWTAPKNLGHTINTYGSEETPFIAADGKTLYFSSNGRPGYGDNDIFMSRRLDNSWTKWTEPLNLGPQINTASWDAYYTITASGDYAYLGSTDHSLGLTDIFRIKVSESAKPEPVVIIHGKVLDKITKQPLAATIDYHELSTGANAGTARSNPTDGSYKIVLPYGKAYGFLAEKTHFLAESDNIDLTTIKEYTEIERDLYLSPIEIGKSITLNNVFFVRSKAELLPDSFSELDRLVKILTDNPQLKIEISGHTDNVGDPALNTKLSEDRVTTIKNYLINKNISAKRLSGKGYGGSKPIASNATEETRKLNRRVEFIIIGK
jgi:outer membrane protein OmpA-like peptidoglycan-associated protein